MGTIHRLPRYERGALPLSYVALQGSEEPWSYLVLPERSLPCVRRVVSRLLPALFTSGAFTIVRSPLGALIGPGIIITPLTSVKGS